MDRPFYGDFIVKVIPALIDFLPVTLLIMAGTVFFSLLLGFVLVRARLGSQAFPKKCAEAYCLAMRCTPSIVLLFIVYYGIPELAMAVFGVDINGIYRGVFVITALTLLYGAAMGEIMRSAYESVDKGQREAALSAGLTERAAFLRIILPQAAVAALPNFGSSLISLMKEGALAYTIGIVDMMGQGMIIIARNYGSYGLETYIALALIYWALTLVIERAFLTLEKRLSRGKRSLGQTA
ncbi:MAG: amino acid ABC transporter permease [Spirochaetaceae bacterium]|jgi:L-cystine transport system permease protein|nr:amino acid ABC transporter permease [Spirochaetaceae bacterium]